MKRNTIMLLMCLNFYLVPSALFSCSCEYFVEQFCLSIGEGNNVVLGVITELGATNMKVEILEDIYKQTLTDTVKVLGQDGLNCGQSLWFSVGDTMVFSLLNFDIPDAQTGELYSWYIDGCGKNYLNYSDGILSGNVDIGIDDMTYDDFVNGIESCVEVSYTEQIKEFAPIGAVWKIRGMNMDDSHQGYFSTCETSGCGGSYWQYEVNRVEEVSGQTCRMIEVYYGTDYNQLEFVDEHAVYEEEGRIYFYELELDTFLLMMDYNLEVGDTLYSHAPGNSLPYSINYAGGFSSEVYASKVKEIVLEWTPSGNILKSFIFGTVDDPLTNESLVYRKVIQGIGNLGPLFGDNQVQTDEIECEGSFLCYEDNLKKYSVFDEFGDFCPCQFQDELSSLDDLNLSSTISLYPNPVRNELIIESEVSVESYTIYDINGHTVKSAESYTSGSTILVDDLVEGLYMLRLKIDDSFITRKLTKI